MVRTKYYSIDKSTRNGPQKDGTPCSNSQNENASSHSDPAAGCSIWRLLSRKFLLLGIVGVGCLFAVDIDVSLIFRLPPEATERKINARLRQVPTTSSLIPVPAASSSATTGTTSNAAALFKTMATTTGNAKLQFRRDQEVLLDPMNIRAAIGNSSEEQDPNIPDDNLDDATAAWHPGYQYRYDSEVNHFMNTDVLDLTSWESRAFERLTKPGAGEVTLGGHCKPPPGIPETCCPGSFSAGGTLMFKKPHLCIPALQKFPFLKQHTREWFDDNTVPPTSPQCDICEVVEVARKHSLTIAFVGDSMHHQVFDGFMCELHRRGYNVSMSLNFFPISGSIYFQSRMNKTLHVHSPAWEDDSTAVFQFYQIYKLPCITDQLENITAQADVLISGWGLHWAYDEREDYAIQTAALFQNITQQGHVQLMVHRETSAQHWDADGGEYSLWWPSIAEKNLSLQCQPFQFNDSSVMWRETAVREGAKLSGHDLVMAGPQMPAFNQTKDRPEVVVLPFFSYTAHHPKMHPVLLEERADCTHYCSTPFVYYPLWRSLRYALNRQFG